MARMVRLIDLDLLRIYGRIFPYCIIINKGRFLCLYHNVTWPMFVDWHVSTRWLLMSGGVIFVTRSGVASTPCHLNYSLTYHGTGLPLVFRLCMTVGCHTT